MALTNKQIEILKVLVAGDGNDVEGRLIPADLDELLDRLGYRTTKASMQFSIRALIKRGLIFKAGMEKRRGRQRVLLSPTEQAKALLAGGSSPAFIEPDPSSPEAFLESIA
jgi:DNA-binding MarR family transcriptional regulator